MTTRNAIIVFMIFVTSAMFAVAKKRSTPLVFVEYNCENLFDCRDDSLKNDQEFLPESKRHWTFGRYWKKVNDIGRVIQQCGETPGDEEDYHLPDLVSLCEVENDSTLIMLTKSSILKGAGYKYVMTDSPDQRGIDVALLYNPLTFRLIDSHSMRISSSSHLRLTRDILYVKGGVRSADTLHIFIIHAPSRRNGQKQSEPYRIKVVNRLLQAIDSIRSEQAEASFIIAGDFNDYSNNLSIQMLNEHGMKEASKNAHGLNHEVTGVTGTYKFKGWWNSLDHIMLSDYLSRHVTQCYILDKPWMLVEDGTWGGFTPNRTYGGEIYKRGVSDHLPIVLRLSLPQD